MNDTVPTGEPQRSSCEFAFTAVAPAAAPVAVVRACEDPISTGVAQPASAQATARQTRGAVFFVLIRVLPKSPTAPGGIAARGAAADASMASCRKHPSSR